MDLLMDAAILVSVQLCFGPLRLAPLAIGQLMLSAGTLAAMIRDDGFPGWLHLPLMVLCAAAVSGSRQPVRIVQAGGCMLGFAAAGAGFYMLGGGLAALAGIALMCMLVRRSRNLNFRWNIDVYLRKGDVQACFPALIDTGNRLREHRSGEPVLIVEAAAAGRLADWMQNPDDSEIRSLPFGVLGSSGEMHCFRCDEIRISLDGGRQVQAPPCWVAVYPGRIPGSACALAPPEFTEAIAAAMRIEGIGNRVRRICNGVFKCKAIHLWFGGADSQGFRLLHRRQRPASPAHEPGGGN